MSYKVSKRFGVLSNLVFVLGAVTAVLAYSITSVKKSRLAPAFTMVSKQYVTLTDEATPIPGFVSVRYQKSDGTWKQVSTYNSPDGKIRKEDVGFGQIGRGVFQIDKSKRVLHFVSQMEASPQDSLSGDLHQDEHFVREETIFGYQTQVLRFQNDDKTGYAEVYYAPALQGLPIKHVFVSDRGVGVIEPTEIRLGEPSESEIGSLPDWPVKFDRFEEKIQTFKDRGNLDAAEQMKQVLQQQRQQNLEK